MGFFDRYTARRVVNDLIDALINEGVSRQDVRDIIDDVTDSEKEYLDINWLYKDED